MSQEILVNITPREVRVAVLDSTILQEIYIERSLHQGLLGNIYKGKVNRLLPGIQAAFIDIGLDRSAFLHVSDVQNRTRTGVTVDDMSHADIRDFLVNGQDVFVQVYKDPIGTKGARLTTQFTIPSRYLVFTPKIFQIAVSQKIADDNERQRLLSLITPGTHGGYIFRTAAEGATRSEIDADKAFLDGLWVEVIARCEKAKSMEVVYEEIPIVLRVMRDLVGFNVAKIRVDNQIAWQEMRAYAQRYVPALVERIEYYDQPKPILDIYSVEEELQKALECKVPLKSGGHLIFDQTEAMTTIDVNTGSYLGKVEIEQTIYKTNLEAVDVIARQVRLRNLGGIIIIDFIDLQDPAHKEHLLQSLITALAKDSVRTQVSELSSLGLVQMTRKRTHPACQGRGAIKSRQTVCYEIFRDLQRTAQNFTWEGFMVSAAAEIIAELANEEAALLAALEKHLGKPIKLRTENFYPRERYDILPASK
jgi:ribonuclease G